VQHGDDGVLAGYNRGSLVPHRAQIPYGALSKPLCNRTGKSLRSNVLYQTPIRIPFLMGEIGELSLEISRPIALHCDLSRGERGVRYGWAAEVGVALPQKVARQMWLPVRQDGRVSGPVPAGTIRP